MQQVLQKMRQWRCSSALAKSTFYGILLSVLAVGAAANYGRIIILRIVGERIVARLRSKLFRQTYVQNAEFFDANRVGDLISRLGSDTIIVGKSITQNLSDGLRAFVSGAAGFSLMAWVSLKLTGVLTLLFPPVCHWRLFLRSGNPKPQSKDSKEHWYFDQDCRRAARQCSYVSGVCWRNTGSPSIQYTGPQDL